MNKPLVPLILALLLSACSPADAPPDTGVEGAPTGASRYPEPAATPTRTITIAADPWCPHNCDAGTGPEGYMIDIAREVFEAAGYVVEYVNLGWARALQLTREGYLDAVVGAFVTDAPDFVFPDIPQGRSLIAFFTHAESDWSYQGLDSLNDQTLLAINGYSYTAPLDQYIRDHQHDPERVWILSGPAPLDRALQLLQQRRTDVFVEDRYVMRWRLGQNTAGQLPVRDAGLLNETTSYVAFSPARPDAEELARTLAEGTRRLQESGRINEILANYGLTHLDWTPSMFPPPFP